MSKQDKQTLMEINVLHYQGGEGNTLITYDDIINYNMGDEFLTIEYWDDLSKCLDYIPKEQILIVEVTN